MKNTATNTPQLGDRFLRATIWELSLLGHKTLDVFKMLLVPGGWFRSLPHVRILLVLSMLVLIFDEDISFSIGFGDSVEIESAAVTEQNAASAGFLNAPSALFASMFSSPTLEASPVSAFAKTELTIMDSQTGSALIKRFKTTATAEQSKLGVDAGVLLASAIAAGVAQTPEQARNPEFTTNYFGDALSGSYPSAWSSWRAMSLAIVATNVAVEPTRDDFVLAAAQQFPDVASAKARIYEALRFYQL